MCTFRKGLNKDAYEENIGTRQSMVLITDHKLFGKDAKADTLLSSAVVTLKVCQKQPDPNTASIYRAWI